MTTQEKKLYLQRYHVVDMDIDQICGELKAWRAKAMKMTTLVTDVPKGGPTASRMELVVEKLMEFEKQLDCRLDELMQVRVEVEKSINSLEDPLIRHLFRYRYICGYPWETVAKEMGYGLRHITRLHQKGLRDIVIQQRVSSG